MNLVLDIASSAVFWRQCYPVDRSPKAAVPTIPTHCACRKDDILKLMPDWVDDEFLKPTDGVFHVLSIGGNDSKSLASLGVHCWCSPVPEGSFYERQPGIYIESPAFMFLHAATVLELPQLIAFGDELCGRYSFDERSKRGFVKRTAPLLTKDQLAGFLEQAIGCHGRKRALRALPYVVENSASPMETFDVMTMCLPARYGGYNLHAPSMNQRVDLSHKAARIAGRATCYLDMGYALEDGNLLDVEHHGKLDHMSNEDREKDFARVSGLREMGIEVIELTHAQVVDLVAYEFIISRIARMLGKRLKAESLGACPQRIKLRRAIFTWNATSGRIRP